MEFRWHGAFDSRPRSGRPAFACTALLAAVLTCGGAAPVAAAGPGGMDTNEAYVESLAGDPKLDINDKKAVFAFVFNKLPDRVKVYPTEHYYYFRFNHGGLHYAGNLRFENEIRDKGKLHFAYAVEFSYWLPPGETQHQLFERKDGIDLDRVDDFTYRLTYGGKSVVFELNRMEGVKPPPGSISPDERYIGPIFDESAVRFFLVYNSKLKQFLYLLDETGPATDVLVTSQVSDRILLGMRTGFAYYRDHRLDRRMLIGVFSGNSQVNNYFDGPFDQLPDNFLDGNILHDAILEVDPSLKGKMDRYGSSFDGETRFMIAPYLHYEQESDLAMFHRCATNKNLKPELYYACFVVVDKEGQPITTVAESKQRIKADRPPRERRGGR